MKILKSFQLRFITDRQEKLRKQREAQLIALHIQSATIGRVSHFYDSTGTKIRGWYKKPLVNHVAPQHPLISRYV